MKVKLHFIQSGLPPPDILSELVRQYPYTIPYFVLAKLSIVVLISTPNTRAILVKNVRLVPIPYGIASLEIGMIYQSNFNPLKFVVQCGHRITLVQFQ